MAAEQIPVAELKVGDVLVGVGVVEDVNHDAFPNSTMAPTQTEIVVNSDPLFVPPTFMCTVERKPKVWRRTIVVDFDEQPVTMFGNREPFYCRKADGSGGAYGRGVSDTVEQVDE